MERKADLSTKDLIKNILDNGTIDKYPRPHYEDIIYNAKFNTYSNSIETPNSIIILNDKETAEQDGSNVILKTKAYTRSINHYMCTYDLSKGEFPIITLRPIAVKSAIGELLWIYQDESNNLDVLKDKYAVTWWDDWEVENTRTIGCCYGETVHKHNLMHNLLDGLKEDPDGRRHIINLWQEDDFKLPHGLKPCAYQTVWNIRHTSLYGDYLDMCLFQRSSDYLTAGCINQVQYAIFLCLVAHHLGIKPGKFTWMVDNVHIYDRHMKQANELLKRPSIECNPTVWINPKKTNFYDLTINDIKLIDYPRDEIKHINPQMKFQLAI